MRHCLPEQSSQCLVTEFKCLVTEFIMDYTSSLGPIDPQIHNGKEFVPALGYLDQVEKMIQKSADGKLTDAELVILQNLDLAMLSRYEQAKNLTITLLKRWLVDYKFRDWTEHKTNPEKLGKPVTLAEKEGRAEEIAKVLSDNKLWHSHGKKWSLTLTKLLRLKIEDYSTDAVFSPKGSLIFRIHHRLYRRLRSSLCCQKQGVASHLGRSPINL